MPSYSLIIAYVREHNLAPCDVVSHTTRIGVVTYWVGARFDSNLNLSYGLWPLKNGHLANVVMLDDIPGARLELKIENRAEIDLAFKLLKR